MIQTVKEIQAQPNLYWGSIPPNNNSLMDKLTTQSFRRDIFSSLLTVLQILYKKDRLNFFHSIRVSLYAIRIAKAMNLSDSECKRIIIAGLLHDVGKIGINAQILNSTEKLSEAQMEIMKKHAIFSVEILRSFKVFSPYLPTILHHHERFDGQGYPYKIKETEIPLLARIISVADTYDAIVTNRPYRKARNHDEAIDEIKRVAGYQLDPNVTQHFIELYQQ